MAGIGPLDKASAMLAAARSVQNGQIRTISENIANAKSTASTPGGDPYARKIANFSAIMPESDQAPLGQIVRDRSEFQQQYNPWSAASDPKGYMKLANVSLSIESTNLQSVIRSYELNLSANSSIDSVAKSTLDLLR